MKRILLFITLITLSKFSKADVSVTLNSSGFTPSTINITLGEQITFTVSTGHFVQSTDNPKAFNDSNGGNTSSHIFSFTPTITGTYAIRCGIHTSFMLATINVTPSAAPTITTGAVSPLTFCGGSSITVPYTITGSVTGFSVQLSDAAGSFNNPTALSTTGSTSTDVTATLPLSTTSGTGYRVRVVSNAQTITGTANTQNISINVDPIPTANFNWNPIGAICISDAVTFTGITSNLTGASINWYFNTTLAGTATNTYIRNDLENGQTGFAVITGTTVGCNPAAYVHTTTSYLATVSGAVTPTLSISNSLTHICSGDTIAISGTPNGGGSTAIFSLFIDNTSTVGGNTVSTKIKGLSAGSHTVYAIMKSSLSCATVQTVTSNVLTVTVNAVPATPIISLSSSSNTIISSASSGNQWLNTATGIIAGETSQSFTTTLAGTYKVISTQNGCSVTSAGFNLTVTGTTTGTTTGISDEITKTKISIYPNPVAAKLMVATDQGVKKSELQINIYDLNQKLVLSQTFTEGICKGGKGKECLCPGLSEIDVTGLSEGVYIVQITDGNKVLLSNKLVKQ